MLGEGRQAMRWLFERLVRLGLSRVLVLLVAALASTTALVFRSGVEPPRSPGTHCDGVPSGGGDGWPNACVLFASSFGSQRSSGQSGFRDRQQGLLQLPQPRATPGEDCVPTSGSLLFVATAPRLLEPNCSFCASPTSSTRARRGRMDRIGTQAKSSMTTSRIFPFRTSR